MRYVANNVLYGTEFDDVALTVARPVRSVDLNIVAANEPNLANQIVTDLSRQLPSTPMIYILQSKKALEIVANNTAKVGRRGPAANEAKLDRTLTPSGPTN